MHNEHEGRVGANGLKANRRRTYVVDPGFQWKYGLTIGLTVFLTSSALSSALYGFLHAQARQRLMNPETYSAQVTAVIVGFGLILSVLTAGAVAAWFIILTHRICGPLKVMERQLRELKAGRFPKMRDLRKRDEFKEFYATFAGVISALKTDKEHELETLNRIMALSQSALECDDDSRRHALAVVAEQVAELRDTACQALGRVPGVQTPEGPGRGPIENPAAIGAE